MANYFSDDDHTSVESDDYYTVMTSTGPVTIRKPPPLSWYKRLTRNERALYVLAAMWVGVAALTVFGIAVALGRM